MKAAAVSMEIGSASSLATADGAIKAAMKLQSLKVVSSFLWHGNHGLQ